MVNENTDIFAQCSAVK